MSAPYPPERRAVALRLAAEVGPAEASRRLDIARSTLRKWIQRDADAVTEVAVLVAPELAPQLRDRSLPWSERQPLVVEAIGQLTGATLQRCADALERNDARGFRDFTVGLGILIDKAQLLAGEATFRAESSSHSRVERLSMELDPSEVEAMRAEIANLRGELGEGDES